MGARLKQIESQADADGEAAAAKRRSTGRQTQLTLMTCIGWGLASFVLSVVNNTFNFVLLRYLTDMVGLSAGFAGTAVAVAKIVDACAHPIIGTISDRTETRLGRRRPFILIGGAICAVAMLATFNLHHVDAIRWAMTFTVAVLLVYGIGFAFVVVPTVAMSAEMTDDYNDRMRLISVRVYMLGAGQLIGSSFGPLLLSMGGESTNAYSTLAWAVAGITLLGCLLSVVMTKNARATKATKHQHVPIAERVQMVTGNKPFMSLLALKLFFWIGVAMTNGLSAFFTKYVLQMSDAWLGIYNALKMVGWLMAQELWVAIARKYGKKVGFNIAAVGYALAYMTWLTAGPGESEFMVAVRALLIGVATGGIAFNAQAMLPDTIQYDYDRTGLRREGVFSGLYSLIETGAFSTGVTIMGFLLAASGYLPGVGGAGATQPQSAVDMIHYAYVLTPILSAIVALFILRFYTLGRAEMEAMNIRTAQRAKMEASKEKTIDEQQGR
jgi:Na+/melibiose symporter and related transporters